MRQAIYGAGAPKTTIRLLSSVAVIAVLSACQPGTTTGGAGDATRGASVGESIQLIERDIEAPDVFQANDRALWDGRPSLGGVWVASPGVKDPERVIIRNETNGKFVIGALFKRERDNPGPPLQLSSDAAAALGIIAGQPTTIDVVALRREEVPDPASAPVTSAPEAVADVDDGVAEEEIIQAAPEAAIAEAPRPDAISAATAALEAAEETSDVAALDGPPMTEAGIEAAAAAQDEATPRRGNWLQRVFGRKQTTAEPEPLPAALTSTNVDDMEAPTASSAAAPAIESSSLDAPNRPAASQQVAATRPAPPSPTRASGGLDRAYVQIGIFSVEQNARNTATALSNAGVLPTVLEQESRGRKFWRVIVGPSTTSSDRAAVIRKAKDLGFTDAYAVSG